MSLGPIIDVAIGLIFVYLLLGLITTAVQELVANARRWRGTLLRTAIADLVANGDTGSNVFRGVFDHGLIRGLSSDRPPSYLPAQKFTLALIDTVSDGSQAPVFTQIENGLATFPQGAARESLLTLVKDAEGDLDVLKASIASWYDDAMDRLSGVYKRKTQFFSVAFGLILAVVLNIDFIRIADRLWRDDALRNNVATAAQAYSVSHDNLDGAAPVETSAPPADKKTGKPPENSDAQKAIAVSRANLDTNVAALTDLKLPIGWDDVGSDIRKMDKNAVMPAAGGGQLAHFFALIGAYLHALGIGGVVLMLAGWVVTGIATSLGAPFWFDLLKNVVNLRSAGPAPARADRVKS